MKKILVIEDDAALLEGLAAFLETENFKVTAVSDGEKGYNLALGETFDLIIMDWGLPSMNGLEICQSLRRKGFSVPIIMLTGRNSEVDRVLGLECGADDYVVKPFATREVLARIHAVLRRSVPHRAEERGASDPTTTLGATGRGITVGHIVGGRYQVLAELGRGGMGRVYKALDREIQEDVALKVLNPDIADDDTAMERFRNELKAARQITHRNVCRVFDLNRAGRTYFLSMEYIAGEDLKSLIRRTGRLPVDGAASFGRQVADGLAEAHRAGIVHRDLKPQNVMIDRDGRARILDFGIARLAKSAGITQDGVLIGTPHYMSPEQADGLTVDARTDIYSLGAILYEMLTGAPPFEADTAAGVIRKHRTEPAPDPKESNPSVPEALSRVVLRCLEKNPGNRYQSAEELSGLLAPFSGPLTNRISG
jgi:CheY-like chemotaxis protein/predicted Ser/Thr protein kinase